MEETKKGTYYANRKHFIETFAPKGKVCDFARLGSDNLAEMFGLDFRKGEDFYTSHLEPTLDSAVGTVLTGATSTPVQFTQFWYPDVVEIMVTAMRIVDIMGIEAGGDITTQQIVRTIGEPTGNVYLHNPNSFTVPTANFNLNFEARDVQILEQGCIVDSVISSILAQNKVSDIGQKHRAIALAHATSHNAIGFFGLESDNKQIYGLLNDPNLLAYTTVATGEGGGTMWSTKTAEEIFNDVIAMVDALFEQTGNNIDASISPTKLVLAGASLQFLAKPNALGISVRELINKTYPQMTILSAPEFNGANGGNNVMYLKAEAEEFRMGTFHVPIALQPQTTVPTARGYQELFLSNIGGVFAVRPLCVVRKQGI